MPQKNAKKSKPAKPAPAKKAPAKAPAKAAAPAKKAPVKAPAKAAAKQKASPAPAKKKAAPAKAPAKEAAKSAKPAKGAPATATGLAKKAVAAVASLVSAPAKKKAPAPAAKAPAKEAPKAPAKEAAKEKKGAHLKVVPPAAEAPAAPAAKKTSGKGEVVVEVPAPKGVALLRGGKEKKKAKESAPASSGKKRCREPGCDNELLVAGYCRLHYIKNWRKIKRKEAILASGQLNNYVEELVNKYPDKYLDVIRQDLASEKDWAKVVVDLELESADEEGAGDEDIDAVAEGVSRSGRGEFDDDPDSF